MSWTLNGVRLYVQKFESSDKQIIARLQPINTSTVLHRFGYEDQILKVSALVATEADKDSLRTMITTGSTYAFVGPEGSIGSYYVVDVKAARNPSICIVLFDRPGLDTDVPIYDVELELYLG